MRGPEHIRLRDQRDERFHRFGGPGATYSMALGSADEDGKENCNWGYLWRGQLVRLKLTFLGCLYEQRTCCSELTGITASASLALFASRFSPNSNASMPLGRSSTRAFGLMSSATSASCVLACPSCGPCSVLSPPFQGASRIASQAGVAYSRAISPLSRVAAKAVIR